jgi:hypothetical protein
MSVETFEHLAATLDQDCVRLCGGEPTAHPRFLDLLARALSRGEKHVFLMTNGLWTDAVREGVRRLPRRHAERLEFLVNVLPAALYSAEQRRCLDATLQMLAGRKLGLGVTVDHQPYAFDLVLELARRAHARQLRFSVAAPSVTDPRTWTLEAERDFAPLARQILALVGEARSLGLRVFSDCGYLPPCAFDDSMREQLLRGARDGEIEFTCHGPLDIDARGEAWRCYGLSTLVRDRVDAFASISELSGELEQRTRSLGAPPLFEACAACTWRAGERCGGGCLALRLVHGLRCKAASRGVDAGDDAQLRACTLKVDRSRLRCLKTREGCDWMVEREGAWIAVELSGVERALLAQALHDGGSIRVDGSVAELSDMQIAAAARRLLLLDEIQLREPF